MTYEINKKHMDYLESRVVQEHSFYYYYSFVNQSGKTITELVTHHEVSFPKGVEISLVNVNSPHGHNGYESLKGLVSKSTHEKVFVENGFVKYYITVEVRIDYKKQVELNEENALEHKRMYQGDFRG